MRAEIEIIGAIFHWSSKQQVSFFIVFVRLISGKKEVDRFTRPRREIGIRYEFDLKVI